MIACTLMNSPYVGRAVVVGPVGLVLTEAKGRPNAMTVSFFSEVAHFPTALWVAIHPSSYTHELIQANGRFTLVVLDETQASIAAACGSVSGREVDKCAGLNLDRGKAGELYMEDAFASAVCRVSSARPLGEHTLFIAEILAGEFESRRTIRRHL